MGATRNRGRRKGVGAGRAWAPEGRGRGRRTWAPQRSHKNNHLRLSESKSGRRVARLKPACAKASRPPPGGSERRALRLKPACGEPSGSSRPARGDAGVRRAVVRPPCRPWHGFLSGPNAEPQFWLSEGGDQWNPTPRTIAQRRTKLPRILVGSRGIFDRPERTGALRARGRSALGSQHSSAHGSVENPPAAASHVPKTLGSQRTPGAWNAPAAGFSALPCARGR